MYIIILKAIFIQDKNFSVYKYVQDIKVRTGILLCPVLDCEKFEVTILFD